MPKALNYVELMQNALENCGLEWDMKRVVTGITRDGAVAIGIRVGSIHDFMGCSFLVQPEELVDEKAKVWSKMLSAVLGMIASMKARRPA